jgi:hypothetical protein
MYNTVSEFGSIPHPDKSCELNEDGIWGVAIRILMIYNPEDCTDTELPKILLFRTS